MNSWIGLIGTVVGAFIAGTLLQFRDSAQRKYTRQTERRALVVEKYELLHQELTDIDTIIGNIGVDLIGVAGLGEKIELGKYSSKINVNSALMHAEFYAPEISPFLEPIQPKLAEFYQIIFQLGPTQKESSPERLALAKSGIEITNQVKVIIKSANKELAKLAREAIHGA